MDSVLWGEFCEYRGYMPSDPWAYYKQGGHPSPSKDPGLRYHNPRHTFLTEGHGNINMPRAQDKLLKNHMKILNLQTIANNTFIMLILAAYSGCLIIIQHCCIVHIQNLKSDEKHFA